MEKRKLQLTGGSSYSLTLPKDWIERSKLKSQDHVYVWAQHSGALLIQTEKKKEELSRSIIKADNLTRERLIREFIARYIASFDEIEIQAEPITPEHRAAIRTLPQYLIGFELIDETAKSIVFKNIFDVSKFPLVRSMEKMFLITASMFDDSLRALKESDNVLAQDVIDRDYEVDKLFLFLTRQFNALLLDKISEKTIAMDRLSLSFYQHIAGQLERIADHAVKLARFSLQAEKQIALALSPAYEKISQKLLAQLRSCFTMTTTLDKEKAHTILDENSVIEKLILMQSKAEQRNAISLLALDSLDRLRGYLMNIAEATLDQAILHGK